MWVEEVGESEIRAYNAGSKVRKGEMKRRISGLGMVE